MDTFEYTFKWILFTAVKKKKEENCHSNYSLLKIILMEYVVFSYKKKLKAEFPFIKHEHALANFSKYSFHFGNVLYIRGAYMIEHPNNKIVVSGACGGACGGARNCASYNDRTVTCLICLSFGKNCFGRVKNDMPNMKNSLLRHAMFCTCQILYDAD